MSLGINLLIDLAKRAAKLLEGNFDIEIIEKHHNQKIDAPSGLRLQLRMRFRLLLSAPPAYVYDRHSQRKSAVKAEIGLHAVRGGTIVGDHDVMFAGTDEIITLSHHAASKEVFAVGRCARHSFCAAKRPGLYDMSDLASSM